ncbi:NADH:ubiquinone reductase (Na(+)-transporting) subunit C [Mesohalobacter halotolerans]|uniref:Na(+)-translocating NADH-quinone reductase subunit C n=1 Tax=Mesohalobacter halotolerans TaxID=1883405 RepID=A0A4U5TNX9_9FLAO|nr:NADH:ubiquinone reductase (Na(+)-transporting) subunit C [Mesohalobacter halotolerans]MBS3738994.1 NADH:ubiquinone reductase (Na(+)-transporting) subunit C [Psychroflexus sp.]TKS55750.1 NADH:ubiquinone reductase (Na(+)-transporting) subunit C [Mesohalobacter halotolerans]
MDKNSNAYTFIFAVGMVIVVAVVLSFLATSLKPMQDKNVKQEKMQNILNTFVGDSLLVDGKKVLLTRELASEKFDQYIVNQYALNHKGENVDGKEAFNIKLANEIKKPVEEQVFPLYEANYEGTNYYVIPLRGSGLWDAIWGYVALKEDLNTIEGVIFDHKGETAGLGAEITTDWFQESFEEEKIKNDQGDIVGVEVKKGYSGGKDKSDNQVNAISGATITGDGVTKMMKERLTKYKPFFQKKKNSKLAIR